MSNISLKNNIKEKVIVGMLWSFAERFGFLTIQFITNIILSRILSPIDFGLIGMLMVFIALSNVIIEGGLGSALIQKKKPSSEDYSTIFYINIIIAIFLYVILYLSSNQISNFYKQDLLEDMLKVIGLVLFFDSLSIVQNNLLMKKLNFKKIAKIKVSAALLSSIVAIISAINGLGVWSLVIQTLLNSFFKTVFFWLLANWKPSFVFSYKSFKELFGYGYKLLTASMLSELFQNLQTLIIGRVFSAKDLGFFTQAKTLNQIPTVTLITVVNQVTFPVYSELNNDFKLLRNAVRKSIKSLVFISFPLMILLAIIAKPLFIFLYTDKWIFSVPYFQLLCVGFGLMLIVHNTNLSILKSVGRSDLVLYLEIVKKVLGIGFILFGLKYGIIGMLIGLALNSYLEFFLNGFFTGKTIGYGIKLQFLDIFPTLLISIISGLSVFCLVDYFLNNPLIAILVISSLFISIYIFLMWLFKIESLSIYINIIKSKFKL